VTVTISTLRSSPVKGFPQAERASLRFDPEGLRDDRRFVIVDETGRVLYGADLPEFMGAGADWDGTSLTMSFADGERVAAAVETGEAIAARASANRPVPGRLVGGPFARALSERAGRSLRLALVPVGVGAPGPVTIISEATLARLAGQLGVASLDPRRFKMSVEIAGCEPHAEDTWSGGRVRVGEAVLAVGGPVPRCVLTTRHPDTGARDLDTLRAILAYRPAMPGGEPPLGVYATVISPGEVRVGDALDPL
jgi:uncharacterized protein YcbX